MSLIYVVSQSQLKWSQDEHSPALQDILHQMNEITQLWLDAQQEYVGMLLHHLLTQDFFSYTYVLTCLLAPSIQRFINNYSYNYSCIIVTVFLGALKEYKRIFEHIIESEKKLDQARKSLVSPSINCYFVGMMLALSPGSWYG